MRVLVVGDVIIDGYTRSHALGISAETPTIVAELGETTTYVGGAGLVARHLLRLGCVVQLVTVGQGDRQLRGLFRMSTDRPTDTEYASLLLDVVPVDGWEYTTKTRHFVDGYKLLQHDVVNRGRHSDWSVKLLLDNVRSGVLAADAVVICDNRHGVLDHGIGMDIVTIARELGKTSYVDSQVSQNGSNLELYKGADFIVVNERELRAFTRVGCKIDLEMEMREAQGMLAVDRGPFDDGEPTRLVVKLGPRGACTLIDDVLVTRDAHDVTVVDTCGAGDAFLAAFVARGRDLLGRIDAANRWAAMSVARHGLVVPRREDLDDG